MDRRRSSLLLVALLAGLFSFALACAAAKRSGPELLAAHHPALAQPDPIVLLGQLNSQLQQAKTLLQACFGETVELASLRSVPVTLTAYSSDPKQCDDTPYFTASWHPVRMGIVAVSSDLRQELGISFGQRVLIPGHGLFEVQDLMNPRWRRRVDIWQSDREVARLFGKQQGTLIWAEEKKEKA